MNCGDCRSGNCHARESARSGCRPRRSQTTGRTSDPRFRGGDERARSRHERPASRFDPPDPASAHLRLGRRRQVDADRPTAVRAEADLRRPARRRSSATRRNSARPATSIDFALLVDGLEAEREQGITIDVAYRYFATARRSFIVADTPGHEQYTRNMATGASNADLAIVLVDARKGLLTQTHRHSIIVSLLGMRHVVLAVNKIDLVDYDERVFRDIVIAYRKFAEPLGFRSLFAVPISARFGDNVSSVSPQHALVSGRRICLQHLETIEVEEDRRGAPFRLPVQWVNRPHLDFRGFAGTIPSGRIARGDAIVVAGSGPSEHGHADPRRRRGGRERRSRRRGHADARRRDRHRPRRRAVAAREPAGGRRPVHRASDLDERRADAARPLLSAEDRRAHGAGLGHRAQAPHRRQQFRQARGQAARPQRGRLLQRRDDDAGRLRPLRRQPRDRRLHPDRPRDQRDGGGGHDRPRAAARDQHPSPRARGRRARRTRR